MAQHCSLHVLAMCSAVYGHIDRIVLNVVASKQHSAQVHLAVYSTAHDKYM